MNSWLISGIIVAVGIFICLILILRSKWQQSKRNIEDYKEGRDKLTFRKDKEESKEKSQFGVGGILSTLIGGCVVLFVGMSLLPIISQQVNLSVESITTSSNLTSNDAEAIASLLEIIPIFFALTLVGIAIVVVASMFSQRNTGGL